MILSSTPFHCLPSLPRQKLSQARQSEREERQGRAVHSAVHDDMEQMFGEKTLKELETMDKVRVTFRSLVFHVGLL